jgi:trans-L-3-hydroxyproline dehydratase
MRALARQGTRVHLQHIFSTIDAHAGGQPLRLITAGVPPLDGDTYAERRGDLRAHHDDIRRLLLHEPRGHADMYGAILTHSALPNVDYGVIFMTNEGYSTMCGHGIIALTTALIETGTFATSGPETRITYETPAGVVQARASLDGGRVLAVRFRNVPAFRFAHQLEINVRDRDITVDVAFGGAWYAIARDTDLGVTLDRRHGRELVEAGMAVKRAVSNAIDVVHPLDDDLSGLYGTIIVGSPSSDELSLRNATIYADGAIDRSPCGTGTSALVACLAADGKLEVGDTLVNESLTGATFTGRIVVGTSVGTFPAVVTEIAGRGAITGMHQFVIDRDDPIPDGFLIR